MIKLVVALCLVVAVVECFPQAPAPAPGFPPNHPKCKPPPPTGYMGPPPQFPPGSEDWPICPVTLTSGSCGGIMYFWDTAKEEMPPAFTACWNGPGENTVVCDKKEYKWDPSKDAKPAELEACEKARKLAG